MRLQVIPDLHWNRWNLLDRDSGRYCPVCVEYPARPTGQQLINAVRKHGSAKFNALTDEQLLTAELVDISGRPCHAK